MEQYFLHSQTNEEHRSIFIDGTQALNKIGWLYRLLYGRGGGGGGGGGGGLFCLYHELVNPDLSRLTHSQTTEAACMFNLFSI